MTWAMDALHRRLPPNEQYPLPPRTITMRLAQKADVDDQLDEDDRDRLSLTAHFAMGTAAGAIFGLLPRRQPATTITAGAGYGLAVWAGNYLGLLPATGLLSPATRHPPRRTALMIAAHLVWGTALGAALSLVPERRRH
jgi:uncharacterized membrane protein YagU involved in acid resistance